MTFQTLLLLLLGPALGPGLAPQGGSGGGSGAAANHVVVFQGSPGQPGDVTVVDTTGVVPSTTPPGLAGVTLLDIEFHGRTQFQRLLPGRPRLEQRSPGLSWLTLPNGFGALYRFSRAEAGGGLTFGLLLIDAGGQASSVFELPGTGPLADQESFSPRIAVAPAGNVVLVATTPAAGGNLLELDLATGVALDRTAASAPLNFGSAGLALGPDWGVAACDDRFLRFDRSATGDAEQVSFGAVAPAWHSGQVALSPSGLFAVTSAGTSPVQAHVWVIGPTADARRASDTEAHVSSAGYLPEFSHGPYLAVSDDGTRAAWRTEGLTREAFLAEVPPPATAPVPSTHVSSDALYLDTLDEIGEFIFRPLTNVLVLAVGEEAPGAGGIEALDFYEADLASGTLGLFNLTATNGLSAPPFLAKSALNPEDGAYALATGEVIVHDSHSGGGGDLVCSVPGQSGLQLVLADVRELNTLEPVDGQIFTVLRRDIGNKDREVWLFPNSSQGLPTLVMTMPDTEVVLHTAVRSDGWVGFVQGLPVKERLWLLDTQNLTLRKQRRFFYGPTLTFAPTGELCFTVGAAGTLAIQAALPTLGAPFRLKVPVGPGFLMPGAAQ